MKERKEGGRLAFPLSSDREDNADLVPLLTTKLETTTSPRWLPPVVGRKRGGSGDGERRRRAKVVWAGKWQVRGEEICGTWEGVGE